MTHVGLICPPYLGHLNPMGALGSELRRRGHTVTFLGLPEVGNLVAPRGLGFAPLGSAGDLPLADLKAHMAAPRGLGLVRIMRDMARMTDLVCRTSPRAIAAHGIEALLVDQLEPAGGLVAQHLGLPFVSVANALPIDRDPAVPPAFTDWPYDPSPRGVRRNRGGERVADALMVGLGRTIARWCRVWGLPVRRRMDQCLSPAAQVSQLVAGFDFPRAGPTAMHPCGPFRDACEMADTEPVDVAEPFVFASLGTLQGGRFELFQRMAAACAAVDVRLVIAHGGGMSKGQVAALPGRTIARSFVAQRDVLARAALAVTNGGLNTVLDALTAGVPAIVVPIAFEQGAIGARLAFRGAGRTVPLRKASLDRLTGVIRASLADRDMKAAAVRLGAELRAAGGVAAAVDVVEAVLVRASRAPGARGVPA